MMLLLLLPQQAKASSLIDTSSIDAILEDLDHSAGVADSFSLSDIWQAIKTGDWKFSLSSLTALLRDLLVGRLQANAALLAQLLALSLFSLLLTLLPENSQAGAGEAARWVMALLLFTLAITALSNAMQTARYAVAQTATVTQALLPVLLPMLAALGGAASASAFSPALLFALEVLQSIMRNFVFPLIWFSALLRLVGRLTPRFSVSRLAKLAKDAALGVMGVVTTLFTAFLGFTGLAGAASGGIAVRAAKAASGAFIPVVGRTLADSLDSVLGTVLLLKNAVGLIGGLALLLVCAAPAIEILIQALLFRLTGALAQPFADEMLAGALSDAGESMTQLFAALAISGLFAFFAVAITVALGNAAMMMR